MSLSHFGEQLDTGHLRHPLIADDDVRRATRFDQAEGFGSRLRALHPPIVFQQSLKHDEVLRLIIDQEHAIAAQRFNPERDNLISQ